MADKKNVRIELVKKWKGKDVPEVDAFEFSDMFFVNAEKTPGSSRPDYKGGNGAAWMKSGSYEKDGETKKYDGLSFNHSVEIEELRKMIAEYDAGNLKFKSKGNKNA